MECVLIQAEEADFANVEAWVASDANGTGETENEAERPTSLL